MKANNYFISLVSIFNVSGGHLVIGMLYGFVLLASYQIVFQFLLLINIIPSILVIYLLPQESKNIHNKKLKVFSVALSLLFILFAVILSPIIIPLYAPEYNEVIFPIQIISFTTLPVLISTIIETSILGRGITKPILISSIVQVLTFFILILLLGESLELIGLTLALFLSMTLQCIINIIFYKKIF